MGMGLRRRGGVRKGTLVKGVGKEVDWTVTRTERYLNVVVYVSMLF